MNQKSSFLGIFYFWNKSRKIPEKIPENTLKFKKLYQILNMKTFAINLAICKKFP